MLDNHPLVSVIIPTYNRAHLIGETLDSVLAQTYTNWECIIVDDGSTDDTDEVVGTYVAKDTRFKYYHRPSEHLPGGNGARNFGFKMSRGEYVNWLDSDDMILSNYLIEKIAIFSCNSKVDAVFCECKTFIKSSNNSIILNHYKITYNNFIENYIIRKINLQTGSSTWSRVLIENYQFDESLIQSQDYDFYARIFVLQKFNFKICNKPLLYVRKGNDSISYKFKNREIPFLKSFLKVKTRIIHNYSHNNIIVNTMANNILTSMNNVLQLKRIELVNLHIDTIDSLIRQEHLSFKSKWFFLKILTKMIILTKTGAYQFRHFYKV